MTVSSYIFYGPMDVCYSNFDLYFFIDINCKLLLLHLTVVDYCKTSPCTDPLQTCTTLNLDYICECPDNYDDVKGKCVCSEGLHANDKDECVGEFLWLSTRLEACLIHSNAGVLARVKKSG